MKPILNYAKELASIALLIRAIELRPNNPFLWASGTYNPIYNDNRMLLGYFNHYNQYLKGIIDILLSEKLDVHVLCGTSLSGIAPAAALQLKMRAFLRGSYRPELVILNNGELYKSEYEVTKLLHRGDAIAATAPWCIPFGMREAFMHKRGFMYIRPEAKNHGKQKIIEGNPKPHQTVPIVTGDRSEGNELQVASHTIVAHHLSRVDSYSIDPKEHWTKVGRFNGENVIVIEDLISTGGSALKEVEACRKAGGNVLGVISIFNYGLESAQKAFEEANCPVWSVSNYDILLKVAKEQAMFNETELRILGEWREDQPNWGIKNGFPPQ